MNLPHTQRVEGDPVARFQKRLASVGREHDLTDAELFAALDELDRLAAVVAAVHTALDQYDADWDNGQQTAPECLATIAKAVRS